MDDFLEPTDKPKVVSDTQEIQNDGQSEEEEEDSPDWTKFLSSSNSISRPAIPKRGDKEFEPNIEGESALQKSKLDRIRSAMFNALNVTRTTNSKNVSYGVWVPSLSRAYVTTARGVHFSSMGYSVLRKPPVVDTTEFNLKLHKRLELLPEETLYLIERGSMFCWKDENADDLNMSLGRDDIFGTPMTVQQAYAEMIGKEELTLEKYQAYAYMRRLGYTVTRNKPPDSYYPTPSFCNVSIPSSRPRYNLFSRILSNFVTWLQSIFAQKLDWWKPLRLNRWWFDTLNYRFIFRSLKFIPSGYELPLHIDGGRVSQGAMSSPYEIFYNIYKPSTSFRKTVPPLEDFSLVVVNARTTPLPTLEELSALFQILPELPVPVSRRTQVKAASKPEAEESTPQSIVYRIFTRLFGRNLTTQKNCTPGSYKPNPFQMLKFGKKQVIVAVVDAGTMSFFRFGEGAFKEWPMI